MSRIFLNSGTLIVIKGTLFSLKMQYLNKEGQQAGQAGSKIWNYPDEVITR
jgi:hypothetical protein